MSKCNVLIVDDDQWLAKQYARMLNNEGFTVQISTNPWGAIQLVDDFKPDVIILDVLLVGSTSFALLHELQSYIDTASVPVIMCTNLAGDMSIDDLKHYGVQKVLDKTKMLPEDLSAAVKGVLS